MGSVPDWMRLIRAAEVASVPPWELLQQPLIWTEMLLAYAGAVNKKPRGRK